MFAAILMGLHLHANEALADRIQWQHRPQAAPVCATGGEGLNIRSRPSLSAPVVYHVAEGATLLVLRGVGSHYDGTRIWMKVQYVYDESQNAVTGWASYDHICISPD